MEVRETEKEIKTRSKDHMIYKTTEGVEIDTEEY